MATNEILPEQTLNQLVGHITSKNPTQMDMAELAKQIQEAYSHTPRTITTAYDITYTGMSFDNSAETKRTQNSISPDGKGIALGRASLSITRTQDGTLKTSGHELWLLADNVILAYEYQLTQTLKGNEKHVTYSAKKVGYLLISSTGLERILNC